MGKNDKNDKESPKSENPKPTPEKSVAKDESPKPAPERKKAKAGRTVQLAIEYGADGATVTVQLDKGTWAHPTLGNSVKRLVSTLAALAVDAGPSDQGDLATVGFKLPYAKLPGMKLAATGAMVVSLGKPGEK